MASLVALQTAARTDHAPVPWREIDGFVLSVEPAGGQGYPVVLTCAEFSVYLGVQKVRPTFWVQVRADFIRTLNIRPPIDASVAVVAQLSATPLETVCVSRVDPFADFGGWSLTRDESDGIVTKVPEISSYFVPRSEQLQSIRVGKKPLALRVYDKVHEIKRKGGSPDAFADLFWGGHRGAGTRVE